MDQVCLTVLMPCLNEASTLPNCIRKAHAYLSRTGLRGEILVADNGSSDGSRDVAHSLGARVVTVAARGYGNALRAGIEAAAASTWSWATPITAITFPSSSPLWGGKRPMVLRDTNGFGAAESSH
jgi:glycosyltransferase involved in cell wall biosynthesis